MGATEAAPDDAGSLSIKVNGRRRSIDAGLTVQRLLEQLEITARYALVERNGEPIERDAFAEVEVGDGDELVIARPVAGG